MNQVFLKDMAAYAVRPSALEASKKQKGIIVLQEAFGVNAHIQSLVHQFADEGYLAIAPELFHRTAPAGYTAPYNDFQSVVPHFSAITEEGIAADVGACQKWLKEQGAEVTAVIGYCLGGRAAFIANAFVDVQAAVAYYGGRIVPAHLGLAAEQKSPILFFWGGLDKHILPEHTRAITDALTLAKKPFVNVEFSGADHAFACHDRPAYDPQATAQAWALTLQFLNDKLC
jgi:carboxymethylenebutenolidase